MTRADHNFNLVLEIMQRLSGAHIKTWLHGGWAEELWGLCMPRSHRDIDLLYPASDFTRLDNWLELTPDLSAISAKQFSHKRAFLCQQIMIEVMLLETDVTGRYLTNFFDHRYQLMWPQDTFSKLSVGGLDVFVASVGALQLYRNQHQYISEAYHMYLQEQG